MSRSYTYSLADNEKEHIKELIVSIKQYLDSFLVASESGRITVEPDSCINHACNRLWIVRQILNAEQHETKIREDTEKYLSYEKHLELKENERGVDVC